MKIYIGMVLGMVAFLAVVVMLGERMKAAAPVHIQFEAKHQAEPQGDVAMEEEMFDASMPAELEAEIEAKIRERMKVSAAQEGEMPVPIATSTALNPEMQARIATAKADPTVQAMIATALAEPGVEDVLYVPVVFATRTPMVRAR